MASGTIGLISTALCLSATLALTGSVVADTTDSTGKLVSFRYTDTAQLDVLNESGVWDIIEVHDDHAVAIKKDASSELLGALDAPKLAETEASLTQVNIVREDIDDELAEFRAKGSEGAYHSYQETVEELNALSSQYPQLLQVETIGQTHEGRDMTAVRLTGTAGLTGDKSHVLIFGLTHAREWISAEMPMFLLNQLLAGYGNDAEVTRLLDGLVIYILPVTNPDGHVYSQTEYKMWRKNRRPNGGGSFGVDVNRNFPIGWGTGSSRWSRSDTYRGTEPKSERETRALLQLFEEKRFVSALSFHSYSELILYPWGYDKSATPDAGEYKQRADAMAALNGYRPGQVSRILYTAGGATDDTFYKEYGAWAYTFELGKQFVPPESEIEPICNQNLPSVMLFLKNSLDKQRPSTGTDLRSRTKVSNFFSLYDIYPLR